MLDFVTKSNKFLSDAWNRADLVAGSEQLALISMERPVLVDKEWYRYGLSIRRAVFMEKRCVLVGLSMEGGCFVEKREIAGRAGND